MIKRKTIETIEEYDASGKLLRKVTTETEDDGKGNPYPIAPFAPYYPWDTGAWWGIFPPYPYHYPSVSATEYKITVGDPPDSCGSGSISCAPNGASSSSTTWKKGNSTPLNNAQDSGKIL